MHKAEEQASRLIKKLYGGKKGMVHKGSHGTPPFFAIPPPSTKHPTLGKPQNEIHNLHGGAIGALLGQGNGMQAIVAVVGVHFYVLWNVD